MKHHLYHPDYSFIVDPVSFDKYTNRQLLQYCLGANEEFEDEVCGFPNKPHDEYVDLLGYAINYLMRDDDDLPDNIDEMFY